MNVDVFSRKHFFNRQHLQSYSSSPLFRLTSPITLPLPSSSQSFRLSYPRSPITFFAHLTTFLNQISSSSSSYTITLGFRLFTNTFHLPPQPSWETMSHEPEHAVDFVREEAQEGSHTDSSLGLLGDPTLFSKKSTPTGKINDVAAIASTGEVIAPVNGTGINDLSPSPPTPTPSSSSSSHSSSSSSSSPSSSLSFSSPPPKFIDHNSVEHSFANKVRYETSVYEKVNADFRFVQNVYKCVSNSKVAFLKGGAVRDMVTNGHTEQVRRDKVSQFYKNQVATSGLFGHFTSYPSYPLSRPPIIPRDIDCELFPIEGVKDIDMTEEKWDSQFVQLFRHLRDEFGKNNVYEFFREGGPRSHEYATFLAISIRTIIVCSASDRHEISIDVISPIDAALPIGDDESDKDASAPASSSSSSSSSSSVVSRPPAHPVETIRIEDALDFDVNGLYAKDFSRVLGNANEFTQLYEVHPRLYYLNYSLEEVIEAIQNKIFTVVAVEALLRTKRLWGRVLSRLCARGWVGRFLPGPGQDIRTWQVAESKKTETGWEIPTTVCTIDNTNGKKVIEIPIKTFDSHMTKIWGSTTADLHKEKELSEAVLVSTMSEESIIQAQKDLNDKLAKQVEKLERKDLPAVINECCVCMDNASGHIVAGCGHLCLCTGCADAMSSKRGFKCPICRVPGIRTIKVFIP